MAQSPPARCRPGSGRPPRSGSAWPTGRCAAAGRRTAHSSRSSDRRDGCRACWAPRRGSRRRSPCAWCASILRPRLGAEQDVERLRRGDDDVRRPAVHLLPLARRRVAGADPGADVDVRQALPLQVLADAGERLLEVLLDVVRQRLERRDVDDLRLVLAARRRCPGAPARRSPPGTRRRSCPSRSAPRSACAGPP